MGEDLAGLKEILRTGNPHGTPLDVNEFFQNFADKVPTSMNDENQVRWRDLPWRPDVDEADKVYFLRYGPNPEGNHVSPPNLLKTALRCGQIAHDACQKFNLSSYWTADPDREKPMVTPKQTSP